MSYRIKLELVVAEGIGLARGVGELSRLQAEVQARELVALLSDPNGPETFLAHYRGRGHELRNGKPGEGEGECAGFFGIEREEARA